MRALLLPAAVLLAALAGACRDDTAPPPETTVEDTDTPPPATTSFHLKIEGDEAGDWMAVGNAFSSEKPDNYRPGVLFQFGEYDTLPRYIYGGFTLYARDAAGEPVKVHYPADTSFVWVDIAGQGYTSAKSPMKANEAFHLYPHTGGPCADCTCPTDPRCLRGKTLHARMKTVRALFTYWHGPNGFVVDAAPRGPGRSDRFWFSFRDAFEVALYAPEGSGSGAQMKPVASYAAGTVDSILVHLVPGPPDRGEVQDPPWLYP